MGVGKGVPASRRRGGESAGAVPWSKSILEFCASSVGIPCGGFMGEAVGNYCHLCCTVGSLQESQEVIWPKPTVKILFRWMGWSNGFVGERVLCQHLSAQSRRMVGVSVGEKQCPDQRPFTPLQFAAGETPAILSMRLPRRHYLGS